MLELLLFLGAMAIGMVLERRKEIRRMKQFHAELKRDLAEERDEADWWKDRGI